MNSIYFVVLALSAFSSSGTQIQLSNVTLPQKMAFHFSGIYNNTFTILHNDINEAVSESTLLSITLNNIKWSPNNTTMPLGVSELRTEGDDAVRIKDKLYIINPETGPYSNHQMFIYNLRTNQYNLSVTPPYRAQAACAVYNSNNNIIYLIGGGNYGYKKYTQRFNVSSNIWITPGADTFYEKYRSGCSLDANNAHIYYFGGYYEPRSYLNDIEKYTVLNDQWTLLTATLTTPKHSPKCRLLSRDGNIYCIGGVSNGNAVINTVDVFDPSKEIIINTMYLHVARTSFTVTLWNDNSCLIISGGWDGLSPLDSIETFGDCTAPTKNPSSAPTNAPSYAPSTPPTHSPTIPPTLTPSTTPSVSPSQLPTMSPTLTPSYAPTEYPSTAPSSAPSISPSTSPTFPPTLTPISSCFDYNNTFSNDGDVQFDFLDEYNYISLNQPFEHVLTVSAESRIECTNNNNCFIPCNDMLSCALSSIEISNNTDKEVVVYCGDTHSCFDLSISIKSMVSMLNLTVICKGDYSCINMDILVSDFNSMNLYCSASSSCLDVTVNIITTNWNSNETENDGIISCISENSCDHMIITTDSVVTQLKMYAHSNDVTLDNKYGYIPPSDMHIQTDHDHEANIVCNDRFIRYETSLVTQPIYNYVENTILNEYDIHNLNMLPCAGVIVKCNEYYCQMGHTLSVPDFIDSDLGTDCYWISAKHFLNWHCQGQCAGSPTESPTKNPSQAPTKYTNHPTFSPTAAPSNNPSQTPTNTPSDSPSFNPSLNPTISPTQAPTRYPTLDIDKMYNSVIEITYILEGLTVLNLGAFEVDTMNILSDIIEFIERSYFVALNGLSLFKIQYRDFAVFINDINGHELSNIYLKVNEEIRLNGIILVNDVNSGKIIEASETRIFWDGVQRELISYFSDNENVIFYVENVDKLSMNEKQNNSSLAVIYLSIFIIFCGFAFSGYILYQNKKKNSVIDNAKYLAPLLFSFQIYDFISDINLSFDILTNPLAHSGNYKSNMIFYCGIASVAFTVLPYFTNLLYAIKIKKQQVIKKNNRADTYFTDKIALFIGLVIISGGCYPSILLCSSRILNLPAFTSGLTRYELSQLTKIKIKSTITLENGPQLIVQIVYVLLTTLSTISPAVFLAFVGSSLSILMAVASYYATKESSKNAEFVSYFMRFISNDNTHKLTDKQKTNIKKNKERKCALQKVIATAFGTSHENIEIGFSKVISNGLQMHIMHFVPGSEKEKFIEEINSGFMGVGYQRFLTAKQYIMTRYNEINNEINDVVRDHFQINQQTFIVAFDDENISQYDKQPLMRHIRYNTNTTANNEQGTVEMMQIMKDIKAIKQKLQFVVDNDVDKNMMVSLSAHNDESGENDGNITTKNKTFQD